MITSPSNALLPFLSASVLEGLGLTTSEVADSIEHALRGQREKRVWCAPKAAITPGDDRYIMSTLGVADDDGVVVTKSLVVNPANAVRGLPNINAIISIIDSQTGLPLAVADGNWITAARTAGLSLVAARRLARADAASIAFIGCGVEAQSHLKAFADSYPIREIHAFGRGAPNRDALLRAAEARGVKAVASATADEAISSADIVITTLPLLPPPKPFLDARKLKAGAFVSMVDLALPWHPDSMTAFDRIIVDDRLQEAAMAKPMVVPALVRGDLSELVSGDVTGRQAASEITSFVFRGHAVGDLAVAGLAWRKAKDNGL
jgi:ornithine cyclodeaminase/alanine dehydrogenase-like protein (mu-crystallin family)